MVDLFRLVGGHASGIVLRFFLSHPSKKIYAEKLLDELKLSKKSLLGSLTALEEGTLIESELQGRTKLYFLNRNNITVKYLKIILTVSELAPKLKSLKGKADVYLYGSAARGEDSESSDLDILVVTKESRSEVMKMLSELPKEKMNVVVMTQLGYAELSRNDKAFYERIEKDKIKLTQCGR